jgi:aerobic carbon-monoxide dehydrogenase small subunit
MFRGGTQMSGAETLHEVRLRVNGVEHVLRVPARRLLADALRQNLGLTGTHLGCEHGVCGACTVLLDGASVRSCLLFAVSVDGAEVTTVEGCLNADGPNSPGTGGGLGPVQQAFADCHALQCGFCTPGFVTTVTAYLRDNPDPTEAEARQAIGGNLCRCTGYQNIVAAVLRAAELQRAATGTGPQSTATGPMPAEPTRGPVDQRGGDAG